MIVEQRQWLTEREYAEILSLCQVIPGPNVGNVAVMVGDRFQGLLGTVSAVTGLLTGPLACLLILVSLYDTFADIVWVQRAMAGVASAVAGLVIGTAIKMAAHLRPTRFAVAVGLTAFVASGLLRWNLVAVVALLAPVSIAAVWWSRR